MYMLNGNVHVDVDMLFYYTMVTVLKLYIDETQPQIIN